jgi:hypothetical protein
MTASAPSPFRVVSFGDLGGDVWGTAIDAGDPAIVFGTPDGTGSASGADAVRLTPEGRSWRLAGEGFELLVTPAGDGTGQAGEEERGGAGDELCEVAGTLSVAGAERSVQCVGTRSIGDGLDLRRLDSVRGLSGWFDSDRGLALLSFRPHRSAGQETDLVAATVFEPERWVAVEDPRLSTTYRSGGRPSRASLELWIGAGEEQYPRRVAAEANGDGAGVDGDRVRLQVTPLRCHTSGLDGAGVYSLARF